ncbi:MAG: D-alanyl-D-alanine carboxypeptidase [Rhodobacteraceae bacterium]|nr:D-alanyl-D-alanine carboxypeptidase [Paracoccaceae bacterium]
MRFLLRVASILALFFSVLPAQALETPARTAMVLDYDTGTVLLAKNADEALPPASMSKLMTLNMVFEALEAGRITLDEKFAVSASAVAVRGSSMFLNTQDRVTVDDLIKGVIVLSGNDAAVVLAEGLGGTEAEFSRQMTVRARELGMMNSTFINATGWPGEGQLMSARDLVLIAHRIIKVFPQYYSYFNMREFLFDGRTPDNRFNRNPLLGLDIGADGLKTGFTDEAGFGLVSSAVRGNRRVIVMINGMESAAARSSESERLISWAFREFAMETLFEGETEIARADVWLGQVAEVGMAPVEDIELLLPYRALSNIKAKVVFETPIEAPISKGEMLGELVVNIPDMGTRRFPLAATEDVAEAGFIDRFKAAFKILSARVMAGDLL